MNFFNIFKNKESKKPVWRNAEGKISCPGDDCPQDCNDSCPIWLNTIALESFARGQNERAISLFKRALDVAPDFVDALNNLGAAYGSNDQHEEARKAFLAAYKAKPGYDKALHGLITAETHLGLKEEALKHCDEYDMLPGCDSKALREKIERGATREECLSGSDVENFMFITNELMRFGREKGFITSETPPYVIELLMPSTEICINLLNGLIEYFKNDPEHHVDYLGLLWSAYAGIGAVYHWDTDWDSLSKDGIFETLTRERGVEEMDEYVLDCIGKPFSSDSGIKLREHLREVATICLCRPALRENATVENYVVHATAMYHYGMVLQMNALGMR